VNKLLAEWFWTDRWVGSSAFLLPIEPRGLYREMLTQAWRRGARLPNDHEAIRRATGCTRAEWKRCWPVIERYWRTDGADLVNDTQVEVWHETIAAQQRASARGRKGAQARAQVGAQARAQAVLEHKPPSPSPEEERTKTNTAASPPRPSAARLAREPADDDNYRVILKLAHEVMDATAILDPTDSDLVDALKTACARNGINYSAHRVIPRALEAAARSRLLIPATGGSDLRPVASLAADLRTATTPDELGERLKALGAKVPRA